MAEEWISGTCQGEKCAVRNIDDKPCNAPAYVKVGEEIPFDDPFPARHNLTAYICRHHFETLMGKHGVHCRMRCIENKGGPSEITHALLNHEFPHEDGPTDALQGEK